METCGKQLPREGDVGASAVFKWQVRYGDVQKDAGEDVMLLDEPSNYLGTLQGRGPGSQCIGLPCNAVT